MRGTQPVKASAHEVPGTASRLWIAATPGVFVVLWSTGYLGARLGTPYVEPMTFLSLRFAAATAVLGAVALIVRSPWPSARDAVHAALAGMLLQGLYLGGVFAAIDRGLNLGIAALVVGLQPLATGVLAVTFLGERLRAVQVLGLVLGFAGLSLVVWRGQATGSMSVGTLSLAGLSLAGITLGTLYQKRFCTHLNLVTGNAVQFAAAGACTWVMALSFETRQVQWTPQLIFALSWLVLVLSLGAVTLLYQLIRRGAASRVSSLFYLVPPVTALSGWLLFGQPVTLAGMAGMLLAAGGVALVMRGGAVR